MNDLNKLNFKTEENDNLKLEIEGLKKEVEALKDKLATSSGNDEETQKNFYLSKIDPIGFLIRVLFITTIPIWIPFLIFKIAEMN